MAGAARLKSARGCLRYARTTRQPSLVSRRVWGHSSNSGACVGRKCRRRLGPSRGLRSGGRADQA
eukprot:5745742-Pyramimonas_sp.AAC.1